MRRNYTAPIEEERCRWVITLSDGSKATCMRRHVKDRIGLCRQHQKMEEAFQCEYCGGNDELPPEHCQDCERPK